MSIPEHFRKLAGRWRATNRLWLEPDKPARESEVKADIVALVRGRFLRIDYTWQEDGPQEGVLLLGKAAESDDVQATWVDSWHNGDRMMVCSGRYTPAGAYQVLGSYTAPSGPDWGWRVVVQSGEDSDAWTLRMFNVTPAGEEMLAVEARFQRVEY